MRGKHLFGSMPALLILMSISGVALASAAAAGDGHDITHTVAKFVMQISVILLCAKLAGEFCERYLKQPAVLAELITGVIIGPFALGGHMVLPYFGALFPAPAGLTSVPVSVELYAFSQLAAVILLFMAGLETNLEQFLRYGLKATIVALGGVVVPFVFGVWATVAFGFAEGWMDPVALFMGAIMTATSVGITARVLSDIKKLDTPEGVTILAAAVVDDVLGIMVLAIVVALAKSTASGGDVSWAAIGKIGFKAVAFWLVVTGLGIVLAEKIEKVIRRFTTSGSLIMLGLSLCFVVSAVAEAFGLAMIIGAYSIGLGLSRTKLAEELEHRLAPIYQFTVPVFFCVMGMLVDIRAMGGALVFGLVLSLLAIVSKLFGCGLPALGLGFNMRGASRIGFGMLPRGEVALIVAGVGLASQVIGQQIFGVSILMTLVTTLMAPIFLVKLFADGQSGLKHPPVAQSATGGQ